MSATQLQEVVDRTRRIETRLTKWLTANGFETGARKPLWDAVDEVILVPNASTSFADCIAAIPADWEDSYPIPVVHNTFVLGFIKRT